MDELKQETILALENSWVTIMAFAGGCWDSLDDLEEIIGKLTGETSKQVNKRLWVIHQSFIKSRNKGQDEQRAKNHKRFDDLMEMLNRRIQPILQSLVFKNGELWAEWNAGPKTVDFYIYQQNRASSLMAEIIEINKR
jgi:hypothetical protein